MSAHLKALREIVIGKLSNAAWICGNVEQEEPAISSVGHARQELEDQTRLEGSKAKEIIQAIKSEGFKVQSQYRTGKFASQEKERRPASRNSVRAQSRLRCRHKLKNFRD